MPAGMAVSASQSFLALAVNAGGSRTGDAVLGSSGSNRYPWFDRFTFVEHDCKR